MGAANGASCVLMKVAERGLRLAWPLHPPITGAGLGGSLACHAKYAAAEVMI